MYPTVIFDDGCRTLAPLTDLRPAFDLRTGVMTTLERVRVRLDIRGVIVPELLKPFVAERLQMNPATRAWSINDAKSIASPIVFVLNGRAPLAWGLAMVLKPGQIVIHPSTGELIAGVIPTDRVDALLAGDREGLTQALVSPRNPEDQTQSLLSRPWHIRTLRDACIAEDLGWLIPRYREEWGWPQLTPGSLRVGTGDLVAHPSMHAGTGCIIDTVKGPVYIGHEAVIRPGAIIIGPCAILEHATVLERATIRGGTIIGPGCKVNGEIGGTIMQGYSNKAHEGYIGDSYLGEWVNLGAGTTTSNLLNTYGEIIAQAEVDGRHERTGLQFLGSIIGDHVKTAILTRLSTGTILGTGSMIATTATAAGTIPAFSWCTDAGRKTYRLDKFTEVAQAAMARRNVQATPAYLDLLAKRHAGAV